MKINTPKVGTVLWKMRNQNIENKERKQIIVVSLGI